MEGIAEPGDNLVILLPLERVLSHDQEIVEFAACCRV